MKNDTGFQLLICTNLSQISIWAVERRRDGS